MSAVLSPLAFQNAELLIALDATPHDSWAALAEALGKDPSNVRKAAGKLEEEGLLERVLTSPLPVLTERGQAARRAAERALSGGGVRHDRIRPDPDQPRKDFDSPQAVAELDELRQSIVDKGVLQNILLRPDPDNPDGFLIVAGERRWRAVGAAIRDGDWAEERPIPAEVRNLTAAQAREAALIENVQRRSLNRVEEGRAYKLMVELDGKSAADIAFTVHKSEKHVTDHIKLVTELTEADLARLLLPKDHPDHLRYRDARLKWRGHEEGGEPTPKAPPPAPPPSLDLGSTDPAPTTGEGRSGDGESSVAPGMPSGGRDGPDDEDDTPDYLRRLAGPGGQDDPEATEARQDAAQALIDAPSAPAASPPPPAPTGLLDALPPSQRLVLVELMHKVLTDPSAEGFQRTEVAPDAGGPDAEALAQAQIISLFHLHVPDGRSYASVGYGARQQLEKLHPGLFGKESWRALQGAQSELDPAAWADRGEGPYLTPWLNGPFELTEAGSAVVAEQQERAAAAERERAEQEARQAAEQGKGPALLAGAEALRARVAEALHLEEFGAEVVALMAEANPLPWRLQPDSRGEAVIVDADGRPVTGAAEGLTARRLLMVVAVNALGDMPTPPWRSEEAEAQP